MSDKTGMSPRTKKILTGVGVGFGTVMVFIASFVLAFTLIVNPNLFFKDDSKLAEENEKLKAEVQTLKDTNEHLNTKVDKYKNAAAAPSVPATVTTPEVTQKPDEGTENTGGTTSNDDEVQNTDDTAEEVFSPDTVDSSSEQTPEDVEDPIHVIEITE